MYSSQGGQFLRLSISTGVIFVMALSIVSHILLYIAHMQPGGGLIRIRAHSTFGRATLLLPKMRVWKTADSGTLENQ